MTVREEEPGSNRRAMVRLGVTTSLILLGVQFMLGIFTNLYVSLPTSSHGGIFAIGSMMSTMMSSRGAGRSLFMFHMMLGPLIVVVGIVTLIIAIASNRRRDLVLVSVGLLATFVAGYGGLSFLLAGGSNAASLLMAVGFLAAFSAYFGLLSLKT